MQALMEELAQNKIVAILRGVPYERADAVVDALAEGGIRFLEFTMNSDRALELISRFRKQYAGKLHIGAGTVLDVQMAKAAIHAGAEYLISPHVDGEVIAYGVSRQVAVWPGAMTPTEVVKAYKLGAPAVKLFPYGSLGPQYLKEIRAPLDAIPLIATGGIHAGNIRDAFAAGAAAVGVGSSLVDLGLIQSGRYGELLHRAERFCELV